MDKILKVEITFERENGQKFVKRIEGETAEHWQDFCTSIALAAANHRMNPPWSSIVWEEHELS